jgi:tetratricopeptide (TPR) repeat protein
MGTIFTLKEQNVLYRMCTWTRDLYTRREIYEAKSTISSEAFTDKIILDTTVALAKLAQINHQLGMNEQAGTQLKMALRLSAQFFEAGNLYFLRIQSVRSNVLAAVGKLDESLKMEVDLCNQMRQTRGSSHSDTIVALTNFANTYTQLNRLKEAENLELEILEIKIAKYGPLDNSLLPTNVSLAKLYGTQSRFLDAEKLWREVVQCNLRSSDPNHPFTLRYKSNQAFTLHMGRLDEALTLMYEVLAGREIANGPAHKYTLEARDALVTLHMLNGGKLQAEEVDLDALEICKEHPSDTVEETFHMLDRLGALYASQGRLDEAAPMFINAVYR